MFSQNNTVPAYLNPPTNLIFEPKKYFITVLGLLALVAFSFFQFIYLHTPNDILDGLRDITSGLESPYIAPNPYAQKVDMSGFVSKMTTNKSAAELDKSESILIALVDKNYESDPRKSSVERSESEVKSVLDAYLAKHTEFNEVSLSRFSPTFSAKIAPKNLSKLLDDNEIAFFEKNSEFKTNDQIVTPHLSLGATDVWNATKFVNGQQVFAGATGAGQTIVLIDDGLSDPYNDIHKAWGACFSKVGTGFQSVCSNGIASQISTTSNNNIDYGKSCPDIAGKILCTHGTSMGDIIAGKTRDQVIVSDFVDGSTLATLPVSGMAPDATIFSIKVGHVVTDELPCGYNVIDGISKAPCYRMDFQEILDALKYVNNIKDNYEAATNTKIAVVSGSLGLLPANPSTELWKGFCDNNNPDNTPYQLAIDMKIAIDNLNEKNIPSFFATGNDNQFDKITFPACISSAISVGALNDTISKIADFSNMNRTVDLVAPGQNIPAMTHVARSIQWEFNPRKGTSQATAIASGTYALLKSGMPEDTQYTKILHGMKYGVNYTGLGGSYYMKDVRDGVPSNYNNVTPAIMDKNIFYSMYVNLKLLPPGGRGFELNPNYEVKKTNSLIQPYVYQPNTQPENYAKYFPSSNNANKFTAARVSFSKPALTHATTTEELISHTVEITDMNNDFLPDVTYVKRNTNDRTKNAYIDGQPAIFFFNRDGVKSGENLYTQSANPLNIPGANKTSFRFYASADMNSDGIKDLVFFGDDSQGKRSLQVWYRNATGGVSRTDENLLKTNLASPLTNSSNVSSLKPLTIQDFNGDGVMDLAFILSERVPNNPRATSFSTLIMMLEKNGTSTSAPAPLNFSKSSTTPFLSYGHTLSCDVSRSGKENDRDAACPIRFYDMDGNGTLDQIYTTVEIVNSKNQYHLHYDLMSPNGFTPNTGTNISLTDSNNVYALGDNEAIDDMTDMDFDGVPDLVTYDPSPIFLAKRRIRFMRYDVNTRTLKLTGEVRESDTSPSQNVAFDSGGYVPYYHK